MAAVDAKSYSLDSSEIRIVRNSVVQFEKSVLRMAAKPGQPETVAAEYRKVAEQIGNLIRKLQ